MVIIIIIAFIDHLLCVVSVLPFFLHPHNNIYEADINTLISKGRKLGLRTGQQIFPEHNFVPKSMLSTVHTVMDKKMWSLPSWRLHSCEEDRE